VRWLVDNLDDPPMHLHRHGEWVDPDDGAGSILGSPALTRRWEHWLQAVDGRVSVMETILCHHVGRPEGTICEACAIRDGDGRAIAESGQRQGEREVYRWSMRAAIASLYTAVVAPGRPNLSVSLLTLARASGDVVSAGEVLARRWPKMADPEFARRHFAFALGQLRDRWPDFDRLPARGKYA